MEKELEEKRQQEEIQRLREEDLKKKKRSGKKDHKEVVKKKSFLERKHVSSSGTPNGQKMSLCNNSRESLVDAKEHSNSNEVHAGKEADDSQKQTEETETLNAEYPRPTSKVEKEKNADAAEIKRPMEDKELKKSKKVMEKDTKEVPEKRSLCGQKESTVSPDDLRMSEASSVDTKEHWNLNEGASKCKNFKGTFITYISSMYERVSL
ncbi:hepatoma-derived growth factor-related protein 2-like [Acanthochromis polyacanthus]|uniref:hepatoma-derived growth factor-related protein 2-like n=1 Tax=Acanthochromis polyacanthus TaxID=80966 RepID=UPI002234E9F2|nr:hepatoma-derived growth factor-related protein 2-like [Acanthochromis polyacanthus]